MTVGGINYQQDSAGQMQAAGPVSNKAVDTAPAQPAQAAGLIFKDLGLGQNVDVTV